MDKLKLKLQRTYYRIKSKCYNPNDHKYHIYGLRGITMCDEWKNNVNKFYDWALNNGVELNLTIDRIDVNGNYEPNNCRWVDNLTQQNNRRDNILLTYKSQTKTLKQWCREFDIYYPSVQNRYYFCKKNNVEIDENIFEAIMKPVFYYSGTAFSDLILNINRNKIPEKYKGKEIKKSMIYYYKHREQIRSNARKRYRKQKLKEKKYDKKI